MEVTGSLAVALQGTADLLAGTAAFRARVEAADAAAAQQKIHYGTALITEKGDISLDEKRPLAILVAPEHLYSQDAEGVGVGLVGSGAIILLLSDVARMPEDHNQSMLDFINWTSLIIDQMAAASGVLDQFPGRLFRLVEHHHRTPRTQQTAGNDHWTCGYEVRYGALQG